MCAELANTNNFVTAGKDSEHERRAIFSNVQQYNVQRSIGANLPICGKTSIIVADRWWNHG